MEKSKNTFYFCHSFINKLSNLNNKTYLNKIIMIKFCEPKINTTNTLKKLEIVQIKFSKRKYYF